MATAQIDIALDNHRALRVVNGDLVFEDGTIENQYQLLLAVKGDYKENPTVGVDAVKYIDDEQPNGLLNAISSEFQRDGMEVNNVDVLSNGQITVDAYYK